MSGPSHGATFHAQHHAAACLQRAASSVAKEALPGLPMKTLAQAASDITK